ncbi:hypothetical protein REC12_08625 [Desulfosporosinus sp. PR]|uniref:hypothetical protein n=1 Tax=Candidatus Desulfosporosinus nitrosoreducens TaxID=3401928 RepID=UPI0027F16C0B|nr:hypothetical protein [Desulfosporosinus sp. PR]MDQ7093652.1 hypothetical protein [Desulfosporosinus sp. PR]
MDTPPIKNVRVVAMEERNVTNKTVQGGWSSGMDGLGFFVYKKRPLGGVFTCYFHLHEGILAVARISQRHGPISRSS